MLPSFDYSHRILKLRADHYSAHFAEKGLIGIAFLSLCNCYLNDGSFQFTHLENRLEKSKKKVFTSASLQMKSLVRICGKIWVEGIKC